jgi:hypothetical protein
MKTRTFIEHLKDHEFETERVTGENVVVVPVGVAIGMFSILEYDTVVAHEAIIASYQKRMAESVDTQQEIRKELTQVNERDRNSLFRSFEIARNLAERLQKKHSNGGLKKNDLLELEQLKGMVEIMRAFNCNVDEFKWVYLV